MDWLGLFLKDWSPSKKQWPLIAVAAVIVVILFKDIGHIKELLSNHVTGTEKKIETLKEDMKEDVKELKEGQAKLENKIDRLLEKRD